MGRRTSAWWACSTAHLSSGILTAMSRNVDVVRQAIQANRSDDLDARDEEERVARRMALWDRNCEYTSVIAALEPATYRGHDGIRRYLNDLADRWAEWSSESTEVRDIGRDTVFATIRFRAVGKDSGVPVEARLYSVFVLLDGKLLQGHTYRSREDALEAAGLTD
jgi:ketosteroid isomerase-like protein